MMRSSLESLNDQRKVTIDSTRSAEMKVAIVLSEASVSFCLIFKTRVAPPRIRRPLLGKVSIIHSDGGSGQHSSSRCYRGHGGTLRLEQLLSAARAAVPYYQAIIYHLHPLTPHSTAAKNVKLTKVCACDFQGS